MRRLRSAIEDAEHRGVEFAAPRLKSKLVRPKLHAILDSPNSNDANGHRMLNPRPGSKMAVTSSGGCRVWGTEEDAALLLGTYRHGINNFDSLFDDPDMQALRDLRVRDFKTSDHTDSENKTKVWEVELITMRRWLKRLLNALPISQAHVGVSPSAIYCDAKGSPVEDVSNLSESRMILESRVCALYPPGHEPPCPSKGDHAQEVQARKELARKEKAVLAEEKEITKLRAACERVLSDLISKLEREEQMAIKEKAREDKRIEKQAAKQAAKIAAAEEKREIERKKREAEKERKGAKKQAIAAAKAKAKAASTAVSDSKGRREWEKQKQRIRELESTPFVNVNLKLSVTKRYGVKVRIGFKIPVLEGVDFGAPLSQGLATFMDAYDSERIKEEEHSKDHRLTKLLCGIELGLQRSCRYIVRSSAGLTQFLKIPWIAVYEPSESMAGLFVQLLFRQDMSGLYICIWYGSHRMMRDHGVRAAEHLVDSVRSVLCPILASRIGPPFELDAEIQLGAAKDCYQSQISRGCIASMLVERNSMPTEEEFMAKLRHLLRIYSILTRHPSYLSEVKTGKLHAAARETHSNKFTDSSDSLNAKIRRKTARGNKTMDGMNADVKEQTQKGDQKSQPKRPQVDTFIEVSVELENEEIVWEIFQVCLHIAGGKNYTFNAVNIKAIDWIETLELDDEGTEWKYINPASDIPKDDGIALFARVVTGMVTTKRDKHRLRNMKISYKDPGALAKKLFGKDDEMMATARRLIDDWDEAEKKTSVAKDFALASSTAT